MKFPQFIYDYLTEREIEDLELFVRDALTDEWDKGYESGDNHGYDVGYNLGFENGQESMVD